MRLRNLLPTLGFALLPAASGCKDLDRFQQNGDESYCGSMVSAPVFHEGFLPEGVPPALRLRVELDLDSLTERPGKLTSDDAVRGLCSSKGRPLFQDSPMRAIPEVSQDTLSSLEFGEGRDLNFFSWVDSSCQGTMLAVTSLMSDGSVEVRLLKPAPLPEKDAPPGERPGFALFHLVRQKLEGCGF